MHDNPQVDSPSQPEPPRKQPDWVFVGLVVLAVLNCVALVIVWAYGFESRSPSNDSPARSVLGAMEVPSEYRATYDYSSWRAWPVQDGRTRPFGTYCDETLRQICGSGRFQKWPSTGIVLSWILSEPSGGKSEQEERSKWEQVQFILCDYQPLRAVIFADGGGEVPSDKLAGKYVSPAELRASVGFDEQLAAVAHAREELQGKAHFRLTTVQLKAEEVGRRLALYDTLRGEPLTRLATNAIGGGRYMDLAELAASGDMTPDAVADAEREKLRQASDPLHVVALDRAPGSSWFSLIELRSIRKNPTLWKGLLARRAQLQPQTYHRDGLANQPVPNEAIDRVLAAADRLRTAFNADDKEGFAATSEAFQKQLADTSNATLAAAGLPPYPGVGTIDWELRLTDTRPFRWAWVALLVTVGILAIGTGLRSPKLYGLGLTLYAVSLGWQIYGFTLRIGVSGFAPVSNMYESVIFAAFMAAVFGLALEMIYRRKVVALAAAAVATFGLVLADQLPLALDPKISPIVPVLRTNYWLTVHVLTIVASYAAATLAWGLGNLSLGLFAFGRRDRESIRLLGQLTYRALQIAVLLLAAGTLLGGWWASESWGRFWGWDPKEVGALIALICYVTPLHARYLGWVRDYGLAISAVVCYGAILISWYVVNFVLASGLHSYGFASGGAPWVIFAVLLNLEWVFVTAILYRRGGGASESAA